jgi:antitoxin HigA-1
MAKRKIAPVHPGEILIEDFLKPLAITQYRLAKAVGVPQRRIGEIVQGKRAISADTAIRLGHALGTSPQFWMNLQSRYELERAVDEIGADARRIERLVA